jgi:hypothetical protein
MKTCDRTLYTAEDGNDKIFKGHNFLLMEGPFWVKMTLHQGIMPCQPLRRKVAHRVIIELVASFHECQHGSP